MLSRGNSNASSRLRQAKSTSSSQLRDITQEAATIIPEIERKQALTAANIAYERAGGLNRSETHSALERAHNRLKVERVNNGGIRQTQSIRFTGPKANPTRKRDSTTLGDQSHHQANGELLMQRKRLAQWDSGCPEDPLNILEAASSLQLSEWEIRKAEPIYSQTSPETRRDRGSRRQGRHFPNSIEYANYDTTQSPESSVVQSSNTLTVPFEQFKEQDQDTTIQMARDQFLRQIEQERLKARPSLLELRKRQSNKTFRRTVRSSSTNSFGNAVASPLSEPNVKPKSFGHKARHISLTLKNKIKRVFHRGTSHGGLPTQQIDSLRPHFHDYGCVALGLDLDGLPIPMPDDDLLDRVNARLQSPRQMPVHLDPDAKPGSIRSVPSSGNLSIVKSRVTSWTDSSAANTMTKQQLLKRLSIIQENGGPHQPSSSAGRIGLAARKGYAVFRKPMKVNGINGKPNGPVPSQRVFSALQKKLDEDHDRCLRQEEDLHDRSPEENATMRRPSRKVLQSSSEISEMFPNTIRVISAHSQVAANSGRSIRYAESVRSNRAPSNHADEVPHPLRSNPVEPQSVSESQDLLQGCTPQQIAEYNEQNEQREQKCERKPLREVKSAFFPPIIEYQKRNTSPYRNPVRSTMYEDDSDADVKVIQRNEGSREHRPPSRVGIRVASNLRSESAYSRTTSGNTPPANASSQSLGKSDSSGEPGMATIITHDRMNRTNFLAPTRKAGTSSNQSSGEWKGWMASQVEKLGYREIENIRPDPNHYGREIGHKREKAHIDDDINNNKGDLIPNRPMANVQMDGRRPPLSHKTSDQMIEKYPLRFPLIERTHSSSQIHRKTSSSSSSVRKPSAVFKKGANDENEKRMPSQVSKPSNDGGRQASAASFQSQKRFWSKRFPNDTESSRLGYPTITGQNNENGIPKAKSTANMYSRNSPERVARLRRMQSGSTIKTKENTSYQVMLRQAQGYHSQTASICGSITANSSYESIGPYKGVSPAGSQKMVESFLSKRNRNIRIAGEDGGSTAFI
ncbi:hypothetical protein MMC14_007449 [Varicellaria rhodocarpa]|nr:hypothetical protein [Varicellaria rhodocarpa]